MVFKNLLCGFCIFHKFFYFGLYGFNGRHHFVIIPCQCHIGICRFHRSFEVVDFFCDFRAYEIILHIRCDFGYGYAGFGKSCFKGAYFCHCFPIGCNPVYKGYGGRFLTRHRFYNQCVVGRECGAVEFDFCWFCLEVDRGCDIECDYRPVIVENNRQCVHGRGGEAHFVTCGNHHEGHLFVATFRFDNLVGSGESFRQRYAELEATDIEIIVYCYCHRSCAAGVDGQFAVGKVGPYLRLVHAHIRPFGFDIEFHGCVEFALAGFGKCGICQLYADVFIGQTAFPDLHIEVYNGSFRTWYGFHVAWYHHYAAVLET